MLKKATLLIISLAITLLVGEFLVRKIRPQVTFRDSVKYSPDCYASSDKVAFKLAANHKCKQVSINGEYNTFATLNSKGYRNKEFDIQKPKETKRILVIGDSMTFGWGLPDKDTYPFILEDILKREKGEKVEVINAGYQGGLSIDGYYVYLKNEGLSLSPDIVILGFTNFNDISDLAGTVWEKTDSRGLPEKVASCCHMADGRILRNKITNFKYSLPLLRESHFYLFIVDFLQKNFNFPKDQNLISTPGERELGCDLDPSCFRLLEPYEKKAQDLLRETNKMVKEAGRRFIVALFPIDLQLYKESFTKYQKYQMKWFPKEGQEDFINQKMADFLKKEEIEYVDLYNTFAQSKERGYPFFPIDAHFNSIGTRIVAEELAKYLSL